MIFGYLKFLKSKDILPTAVALIVGGLVSEIINRVKDDIILPLSKLDYKTIWKRVSIKEYIQANPETDHKYHKESVAIKRVLYPPTMMATLLFVAMVIFDGGWLMGQMSRWWFHGFYIATVYYFVKSLIIQHKCFRKNTLLILEMTKTKAKINLVDPA